ncbi:hypothetical protein HD596_008246 [Nonomuraea jabiensis]|uniref:Uncharacterized protein n=1 Tax=Nonomuraea jabiensis TaxID=882448 RepID=A0A7W9GCY3_9ACTN|nr:hypothetical protein [Nonomuraea jabiensis]
MTFCPGGRPVGTPPYGPGQYGGVLMRAAGLPGGAAP